MATLNGQRLVFAAKEFDLLLALASRHGQVVTKAELLAEVWQEAYGNYDRPSTSTSRGSGATGEVIRPAAIPASVRRVGVRLRRPRARAGLMRWTAYRGWSWRPRRPWSSRS